MLEQEKVFGAVMIKLITPKANGRDIEVGQTLVKIAQKEEGCAERKILNECGCNVMGIVRTIGHYDYMILLQVSNIKDLENYIIHCIRGGPLSDMCRRTRYSTV